MARRASASAKVKIRGPIFNAERRETILKRMRENILKSITKFAFNNVSRIFARKIKNPTPIYQTHIRVDDRLDDLWRVTDDGIVVYNYWLEGIGSRNFPVTSFKGYHAWEQAGAATSKRALKLAETQVKKAVRSLGGNKATGSEDNGD